MIASRIALQHALRPGRRVLAGARYVGWRTAALGALALLGSTLGVVATANTSPEFTGVSLSASVINEGGDVTLSGSFTDPDPDDSHTIQIEWHSAGSGLEKIHLPPGQMTFQTTKTFKDNRTPPPVRVSIIDHQLSDANDNTGGIGWDVEYLPFEIKNVAPNFAKAVEVKKFALQPGKVVIEGNVIDPGADTLTVTADFGTAQPFPTLRAKSCSLVKGHFTCEHTYPATPRTYNVALRVADEDGGHTTQGVRIDIP